jgi:hypothetical protein
MALSTALEGFEGDIIVIILGYLDLPDILHVRLVRLFVVVQQSFRGGNLILQLDIQGLV